MEMKFEWEVDSLMQKVEELNEKMEALGTIIQKEVGVIGLISKLRMAGFSDVAIKETVQKQGQWYDFYNKPIRAENANYHCRWMGEYGEKIEDDIIIWTRAAPQRADDERLQLSMGLADSVYRAIPQLRGDFVGKIWYADDGQRNMAAMITWKIK